MLNNDDDAPDVVIVNETAARSMFPGGEALGQFVQLWYGDAEVVGVVGDYSFDTGPTFLHQKFSLDEIFAEMDRDSGDYLNPLDVLSDRQREVLKLLAEGHGTRAIADTLSVSVKTVETHRAQLMDKLDIRDVPGLTKFAIRQGLVSLDEMPKQGKP